MGAEGHLAAMLSADTSLPGANLADQSGNVQPQFQHHPQQHQAPIPAQIHQTFQQALAAAQRPVMGHSPAVQKAPQAELMMEMEDPEDSDDEAGPGRSEKRAGRRKIRIEYIEDKSRRHITFSKRKAGIMKKASRFNCTTILTCTRRMSCQR